MATLVIDLQPAVESITVVEENVDEAAGWARIETCPVSGNASRATRNPHSSGDPFTTVVPSRSTAVESVPWT